VFMKMAPHTICVVSNCVLVGNSADNSGGGVYGGGTGGGTLVNCTILNNWGRQNGGGASGSVLLGCTLKGNRSSSGGGSSGGTLTNCLLIGNSSSSTGGGGSYGEKLVNCTVVSNSATFAIAQGGGIANATIVANSIVVFNRAAQSPNYWDSPMAYSCTTPAASGSGNITNEPQFFDPTSDNYRLEAGSPCIGAGTSSYIQTSADLDGNPRISGGAVDIGAYEFVYSSSVIPYAWAQQYGLATDGSADFLDSDGDGMNNWQEWVSGTNPTNTLSVLRMLSPATQNEGVRVGWQSVPGKTYYVQRGTNLEISPAFQTLGSNVIGEAGTTIYTDTSATNGCPYFYRVGVQ
jgi:parallel beta-helix repeat protein